MKLFWSWQADAPGKIGRFLVRDAAFVLGSYGTSKAGSIDGDPELVDLLVEIPRVYPTTSAGSSQRWTILRSFSRN
jgi:hypothetical protein